MSRLKGSLFERDQLLRVLRSSSKDESPGLPKVVIIFESSVNMNGTVRKLWVRSTA